MTVTLKGELPRGWRKRFAGVVALLDPNSDRWGEITLHKGTLTVAGVREGYETDLRHLLESTLMQVNADLDSGQEHDDGDADEDDQVAQADARMTDTFRGFGSTSAAGDA
ncbi:MAG TPA: hypothetical protein VGG08_04660 [Solirubrobacteraceae bacterium]